VGKLKPKKEKGKKEKGKKEKKKKKERKKPRWLLCGMGKKNRAVLLQ